MEVSRSLGLRQGHPSLGDYGEREGAATTFSRKAPIEGSQWKDQGWTSPLARMVKELLRSEIPRIRGLSFASRYLG
jgi:hypothetical protein